MSKLARQSSIQKGTRIVPPSPLLCRRNLLLAAVSAQEGLGHVGQLELGYMKMGSVIYDAGDQLTRVFFPVDCLLSLVYVTEDGASTEIAVIGYEGMVGTAAFMGSEHTPHRTVVKSGGYAYSLPAAALRRAFNASTGTQLLLLRYTQALLSQLAQTAVCYRHHSLQQQLCRSLLLSLDRLDGNELTTTHALIADMLGVRRESVSEAAACLQRRGIIKYSRGKVTVIDRSELEALTCECYSVVRLETDRLRTLAGSAHHSAHEFRPSSPQYFQNPPLT